jgi:hypothetical protein
MKEGGVGEIDDVFVGGDGKLLKDAEPHTESKMPAGRDPSRNRIAQNVPGMNRRTCGMTRRIELALLPVEAQAIEADCFVVIDVLRATTTVAVLFERGLRSLVATDDIELARTIAREESRLLFGEVRGLPPPGFDHGNSPVEAMGLEQPGGTRCLPTNGSRALCAVARSASRSRGRWRCNGGGRAGVGFERWCFCAGTAEGAACPEDHAAAVIIQRMARLGQPIELATPRPWR